MLTALQAATYILFNSLHSGFDIPHEMEGCYVVVDKWRFPFRI